MLMSVCDNYPLELQAGSWKPDNRYPDGIRDLAAGPDNSYCLRGLSEPSLID